MGHRASPGFRLPQNKWQSDVALPLMRSQPGTKSTTFLLKSEQHSKTSKRETASDAPDNGDEQDSHEDQSILNPVLLASQQSTTIIKTSETENKEESEATVSTGPLFLLGSVQKVDDPVEEEIPVPVVMSDEDLIALKEGTEASAVAQSVEQKVEPSLDIDGEIVEFLSQGKKGRLLVKNKDELEVWEARKGKKYEKVAATRAVMIGKGAFTFTLDDGSIGVIGANGPNDVLVLDTHNQWMATHVIGAPEKRLCCAKTVSIANGRQGWLVYCVGGVTDGNPVDTIRVVSIKGDYCSFSDYLPSGPLPPPRTDHAVTKVGDRLLMTGGISNGKPLGDLWELDITQNPLRPKWVEHQASHLPPRSKHFAYQKHGCLFVCGGVDVNNKRLNDIWKWEPSKGWSKAGFVVQPELVLGAFSGGLVLMSQTFKPVRPGTVADSYQSKVAYLLEKRKEYISRIRKNRMAINEIRQEKRELRTPAGEGPTLKSLVEQLKLFLNYSDECGQELLDPAMAPLVEKQKYTRELSETLQKKRERVKTRLNRELMDKRTEALLYSSVKSNLEQKHGPLGKSLIALQTTDFGSFSQFIQHLEPVNQNLATAYFYSMQLHHYERNIRRIKQAQKVVDSVAAKFSKTSHTISNMMKELISLETENRKARSILKLWEDRSDDLDQETRQIDEIAAVMATGEAVKKVESNQKSATEFESELRKVGEMEDVIKSVAEAVKALRNELRKPKRDLNSFQQLQMKLKEAAKGVFDANED